MNKKEWLEGLIHLDGEISQLKKTLKDEWLSYAIFQDKVNNLLNERKEMRDRIMKAIEDVEDPLSREILTAVYVNRVPVRKVRVDMSYSEVHLRRLLKAARDSIQMPGEEKRIARQAKKAESKTTSKKQKAHNGDLKGNREDD